uniref:Uncharacterized protein n=1 Tax=Arundo donax TaxID=35708 RepID=A0A0A8Z2I7_ARUDO
MPLCYSRVIMFIELYSVRSIQTLLVVLCKDASCLHLYCSRSTTN